MAIDGNPATAWGIYPEVGKPHQAVFEIEEPIGSDGGTTLTFVLEQTHGRGHLIGRLRLSVTTDAAARPWPGRCPTRSPDPRDPARPPERRRSRTN